MQPASASPPSLAMLPPESWRAPAVFAAKIVAGLVVTAWLHLQGPVQGFVVGLRQSAPAALRPHLDALLVPYAAAFCAAALVGLAVSAALSLRQAPPSTRTRSAWICVAIGALLAVAVHVCVGDILPMASRQALFGADRAGGYAVDYPPYLLTNGELSRVQAYFERQGGYSPRISLMWQLRLWSTLLVPVFGLLAGAAVARAGERRTLRWFCGVESAVAVLWLLGTGIAVGPAAFARPAALPQTVAWVLLAGTAAFAVWQFRRALQALEAEEFESVVAAVTMGVR
jgi:hypothetical protein